MVAIIFSLISLLVVAGTANAVNHAEVAIGVGSTTGMTTYNHKRAAALHSAGAAANMSISGDFRLRPHWAIAPSFSVLSSKNEQVELNGETHLPYYLQQREFAVDLLTLVPNTSRMWIGTGFAASWWNATAERKPDGAVKPFYDDRTIGGAGYVWRVVSLWHLRRPAIAGGTLRFAAGIPVIPFGRDRAAASGYVAVSCGFSLPLVSRGPRS